MSRQVHAEVVTTQGEQGLGEKLEEEKGPQYQLCPPGAGSLSMWHP